MKIRLAKTEDFPEIMEIVRQTQEHFRNNGIPQWQDGYPSRELLEKDFAANALFVLTQGVAVIGMAVVQFGDEPAYATVEGGAWEGDGPYAAIHRVAVLPGFHGMGLGRALIGLADKLCEQRQVRVIRGDTHEKNIPMRRALEACGFSHRGTIYLEDGSPRVAYEKLLP